MSASHLERNDHWIAEHDARDRARKADKDQPSHDRQQKEAAHNFNGRDDVAIERLRIHVAIANSRQRLHAEKEAVKKPMPTSAPGDTVWLETVEGGEKKV